VDTIGVIGTFTGTEPSLVFYICPEVLVPDLTARGWGVFLVPVDATNPD
jgi:hypothetical protein